MAEENEVLKSTQELTVPDNKYVETLDDFNCEMESKNQHSPEEFNFEHDSQNQHSPDEFSSKQDSQSLNILEIKEKLTKKFLSALDQANSLEQLKLIENTIKPPEGYFYLKVYSLRPIIFSL